ncbi:MAG: YybH family protein [Gemmatimonadales bacterium]
MRHHAKTVVTIALLAVTAGCQSAPASTELSDADVTAVKSQIDRWAKAALAADWTAGLKELTNDAVWLPPNAAPLVGHDALLAWLNSYPKITRFDHTVDEVVGHGDLAYARGTYDIDVTLPDKTTATEKGSFLEIHRKQADGTWRYTRVSHHPSSPPPAPAAAAKK